MTDELHYRRTGGRLMVREPGGDRRLFATVFRWNQSTRLSTGGSEWFNRDREPPLEPAVLAITHGGPRAGQVIQWRSSVLGLDAVLLVDESEVGDGLLALLDKYGELPCSPAFRGAKVRHSTGTQWRNLAVRELAVCAEAEFAWAKLRRFAGEFGSGGCVNPVCGRGGEGSEAAPPPFSHAGP
jgi:hypothetical protein